MIQEGKKIIRFGILCDGVYFQEWQSNAIKSLLEHQQIACRLLIFDKRNEACRTFKNRIKKIKLNEILWHGYSFMSKKATKLANLSAVLADVPTLECEIIKKWKLSGYFHESDISVIRKHNLDFILRFGCGPIGGEMLTAAKYGVWSFHHGDEMKYRGGPPCFWEIFNNDTATGSVLQRLTGVLDHGIVLRKGFLKTKYWYEDNRDQMCLESARWPAKVCTDILNGNIDYLHSEPSSTKAKIYCFPTNVQFIKFFFKSAAKILQGMFRKLALVDYWNIGIAHAPPHAFLNANSLPPVKWFPGIPKDRFCADPFGLVDGTKLHIFYEEYLYNERKGKIAYTCYENGQYCIPQTIINESFHLSYPYLFKAHGNTYMVPESHEANKIMLYKATHFPLVWQRERILIDNFAGIDSTLFEYKGTWWMFTSDNNDGSSYNLNLFYADDIFDEWQPHPQNPIKTDVRSARSAGTPFAYKGELYRPSMNYSEKVEGSIAINKIVTITKDIYQEVTCNEVRPYQNSLFSDKIHHLCGTGEYTVIDGCKESFMLTNINFTKFIFSLIVRKLKRIFIAPRSKLSVTDDLRSDAI